MKIDHEKRFFAPVWEQLKGERGVGAQSTVNTFDPFPENKRVLEIGFGQGELTRALKQKGNLVCGMDIGEGSINGAINEQFLDSGWFLHMDVSYDRFPFIDDFFDYAYATEVIEHLENPYHMFCETKRTLKGGGIFIVAFPRPEDNLGYNSGEHAHMYPGFLLKGSFRMFVQQMYFKILNYWENGSSAWYKLENVKNGEEMGVHEVIRGNYSEDVLYGKLKENAYNPRRDPQYIAKTLTRLGLEVKR